MEELFKKVEKSIAEETELAKTGFGLVDHSAGNVVSAVVQRAIDERAELMKMLRETRMSANRHFIRLNSVVEELQARIQFLEGADPIDINDLALLMDRFLDRGGFAVPYEDGLIPVAELLLDSCIILKRDPKMHGLNELPGND